MDDRTAKKLIDALDRNTEALEASNKLTSAVLKASGKQAPASGGRLDSGVQTDAMLAKFVDGAGR